MTIIYIISAIFCSSLLTTGMFVLYNKVNRRLVERKKHRARTCKW